MDNTVGSQDKIQKISTTDMAFIAGFLEGDGCISAKIVPTSGSYRIQLVISFAQLTKNRIVLEHIQGTRG